MKQNLFFSNSDIFNCTLVHVYELLDLKGSFIKVMKGKLLVIIIQSSIVALFSDSGNGYWSKILIFSTKLL